MDYSIQIVILIVSVRTVSIVIAITSQLDAVLAVGRAIDVR